jgi:hypothetical protein
MKKIIDTPKLKTLSIPLRSSVMSQGALSPRLRFKTVFLFDFYFGPAVYSTL